MSVYKNEDDVIEALKTAWKDYNPYTKVNLASYKADEHFEKWFKTGMPQLMQPEVDVITCEERGRKVNGYEVKYFRMTDKGINYSYYEGLGEALALLKFGFDRVALVHVFDGKVPKEQSESYAKNMASLLKKLQLPIDYRYYRVEEAPVGKLLSSEPYFDAQSPTSNPFIYEEDSKKALAIIRSSLRIPTPP